MATVSKWTPFGVALDITATAGTITRISATQYTVVINASWETYYSGASTIYGMSATSGGTTKVISSFGTKRSSGSGSFTGTYSISGNGSATKSITITFKNYAEDWQGNVTDTASKSVTVNVNVPAWTSYVVKYNANGGTGAPSNQTKWKNQTLTLSSTKPTRTGYSFQGWATSASGSVAYAAGASYTANAAVTLYAVWKANTYTVEYNANGGSGAPSNQTKTYGVTLTLSSTKPTRTNYNFKGWGTSASATTVTYAAGANYTTNAAITLYAVWEIAYIAPRITGFSVARCSSDGVETNNGTYALIKFNWACDNAVSSIVVEWTSANNSGSSTITGSGTSGAVNGTFGNGDLLSNVTYTITATVADSSGSSSAKRTLKSATYLIHGMPENKGIAFGKSAEIEDTADFEFEILGRNNISVVNDKSIMGTDTDGTKYHALMPVTASGNTSLGYGLYKANKGHTHIYGNMVRFYTNEGVHFNGNKAIFNNNTCIYGTKPDGTVYEAINLQNESGNLVLGYDNYDNKNGQTNIYGYDINFGVSNIASPGTYRPYRRKGDTINLTIRTSGFITNNGTELSFWVPFSVPVIGSPTVSVSCGYGFQLRQGNKYLCGSSASAYAIPASMAATAAAFNGVHIKAIFSDTTNVTNNDTVGIYWNGTITFS